MGEIFQGTIHGLSFKGLGVTKRSDGKVFFIEGAWPGDEILCEIKSEEKNHGFATIKEIIRHSSARRPSPCPHFGFKKGECGGCPWITFSYQEQINEKQKLVEHLLARAKILGDNSQLKKIMAAPEEFGYRNRAQFKTDGKKLGYVSAGTREIAPIENCMILNSRCQDLLQHLRRLLPNPQWLPAKDWNAIDIDDQLEENKIILNERIPFRQANTQQNLKMREWLTQKLKDLTTKNGAIELFCGSGNFTEVLSEGGFEKILAVEAVPVALEKLREKNLKNMQTMVLDLYKPKSFDKIPRGQFQTLFLDPPREGFEQIDLFLKANSQIRDIFYVSCDLSTYINDVKKILKLGYEVVEIQPVDQFPQTAHIEILSHLKLCD